MNDITVPTLNLREIMQKVLYGKDMYGRTRVRLIWQFLIGLIAVGAIVSAFVFPIYYGTRAADRSSCYGYGHAANRDVRFRQYNVVSWECLVKLPNGKFIPKDKMIANQPVK